jgi:serine/threonine protein kinase
LLEANTEAAGKTLGRYKILGELGRGAMGAVYRAIDPLIDREVAIKTLLPNLPEEAMAEVKERFIREARSAGRLNHPNIVTVFDVGEQDGMAYMAMEILRGRSLQQILKEGDRLPFERTADIAAQVAEALDNAQEHGIAHRDVKPANVMVNDAWHCKLTDFGVAYVPSSTMTQTGAALGSPRYMSPEQVLGLRVDPRCDIFSLGVMLYEMLSNRTPFEHPSDTSVFQLMNRIAGEPHTPIRNIDSAIPEAFEQILSRALAKKPEQRYARAGEMAADLRNVQRGIPPAAVPAYEKTVLASTTPRGRALPRQQDDLARTQLLNDLDSFVENFEKEEQDRLQAEAAERARKEEKLRSWTSFEGALPPAAAEKKRARHAAQAIRGAAAARGPRRRAQPRHQPPRPGDARDLYLPRRVREGDERGHPGVGQAV